MKNLGSFILMVCTLIALALPSTAWAAKVHGVLRVVKGKVEVKNGKTGQVKRARLGQKVYPLDTIITKKDSRAKIVMVDKNEINVSPESEVKIEKYDYAGPKDAKKSVLLNVIYGKVRNKVNQKYNGKTSKFQVKTPSAVAGVRGTDFFTSYQPATQHTEVVTFEGQVEFGLPGANGAIRNPVKINVGQMASSAAGAPPATPIQVPKSQLAQMDNSSRADVAPGPESREPAEAGPKDDKKQKKDDGPKKGEPEAKKGPEDKGPKKEARNDKGPKGEARGRGPAPGEDKGPKKDARNGEPGPKSDKGPRNEARNEGPESRKGPRGESNRPGPRGPGDDGAKPGPRNTATGGPRGPGGPAIGPGPGGPEGPGSPDGMAPGPGPDGAPAMRQPASIGGDMPPPPMGPEGAPMMPPPGDGTFHMGDMGPGMDDLPSTCDNCMAMDYVGMPDPMLPPPIETDAYFGDLPNLPPPCEFCDETITGRGQLIIRVINGN